MPAPPSDSEFVDLRPAEAAPETTVRPAVELRPRGAAEQVDLAVDLLRGGGLALIGVCVALWFPFRAAMPWLVELTDVRTFPAEEEFALVFAALFAMVGAQTVVTLLGTAVVTVLVHGRLVGRRPSVGDALLRALRRLPGLVAVLLVQALAVGAATSLLVLLGFLCPPILLGALVVYLWLTWKLWLAPSALVLEGLGPLAALQRSWELGDRAPWRWLGVFVLTSILASFFAGVGGVGDNLELRDELLASTGVPLAVFNTVFVGVSAVFFGLSTAIQAAAITIHYLDARIRREGFDLVMRLDRLRARRGEPAP